MLKPLGLGDQLAGAATGRTWLNARGPALAVRSPVDGRAGLRFHWLHARYSKLKYDLLANAD